MQRDSAVATGGDLVEQWAREHHAAVHRAARMLLRDDAAAHDVAQETFVRAVRAAPASGQIENPRAWLCRVGVNLALSRLRSARRERAAFGRIAASTEQHRLADRDATESIVLAEAIGRLPEWLRVPIVLRYYVDLSEHEIARLLSVRRGTVKSRLHRARQELATDAAVLSMAKGGNA